jgi:glycosyltransferase involved in cell wall biosynthesis
MHAPQSVLFVTRRWARDGGVGAHAIASAGALTAHGLRVDVLAARIDPEERVAGVTVHERPALFDTGAPVETRLGAMPAGASDAVHVHQLDDPEIVQALRAIAPVIVSAHGYTACTSGMYYFRPGHECTRAHGPACGVNLLARGCAHTRQLQTLPAAYKRTTRELDALRHSDLVVAYSSSVDRHLANNGLTRRRVIPLFSTMAPRTGSGHETRRRVVFAGRLAAPKGVDVLLRAARDLDGELVVCGSGWQLESSRRLARKLGIEQRVTFKGWLTAEQLAKELADASVVVLPSLWPEPFGLVGIEALAAGRPVVASATGGIADWLDHGVSGLLVDPGDPAALARALNELLADPARQREMGAAGRERVARRFTPEHHVAALLDAYSEARTHWSAERSAPSAPRPPVTASA